MASPDFNQQIVAEFRVNGGKVGRMFEGMPMLLLTTTGAKSGEVRTTPLVCLPGDNRWYIFASKGGAPEHPAWYHNLVKNPETTIEVGTEKVPVKARVLKGAERDEVYAQQVKHAPQFGEYEEKAKGKRTIPVVALERK